MKLVVWLCIALGVIVLGALFLMSVIAIGSLREYQRRRDNK